MGERRREENNYFQDMIVKIYVSGGEGRKRTLRSCGIINIK